MEAALAVQMAEDVIRIDFVGEGSQHRADIPPTVGNDFYDDFAAIVVGRSPAQESGICVAARAKQKIAMVFVYVDFTKEVGTKLRIEEMHMESGP